MKTINEIIIDTCNELIERDFKSGFNESVAGHCRDALTKEHGLDVGRKFWSNACNYSGGEFERRRFLALYSRKALKVFQDARRVERDTSNPNNLPFEMPSWGWKGT